MQVNLQLLLAETGPEPWLRKRGGGKGDRGNERGISRKLKHPFQLEKKKRGREASQLSTNVNNTWAVPYFLGTWIFVRHVVTFLEEDLLRRLWEMHI